MPAPIDSDTSVAARIRARAVSNSYRQIDPGQDLARLLASYQDAYPTVNPAILVPLARAGFAANSREVQRAVNLDQKDKQRGGAFAAIGDVIGGVKDVVGAVASPVARVADTLGMGLDESVGDAARGTVRALAVIGESGLQQVQNFLREGIATAMDPMHAGDYMGKGGTTSATEVLKKVFSGDWDEIDLGTGFLPGHDSAIEKEVRKQAGEIELEVNGVQFGGPGKQAITLGRVLAANIGEPGDMQYNILSGLVDAGVAWFGDPANAVGSVLKTAEVSQRAGRALRTLRDEATVSGIGKALGYAGTELLNKPTLKVVRDESLEGKAIDAVIGRVSSHRKASMPEVTETWLTKGGRRVIERIAATTDRRELYEALGRKVPIHISNQLADAATDVEVTDILRTHLGLAIKETPEYLGYTVRRANKKGVRWLGRMPAPVVDPNDLDEVYGQVDNVLKNMKVAPEVRTKALANILDTDGSTRTELVTVLTDAMGEAADDLVQRINPRVKVERLADETDEAFAARKAEVVDKTKRAEAKKMTRLWREDHDRLRAFVADEIIANRKVHNIVKDGDPIEAGNPYIALEYLNSLIPLPNAREIRRTTSELGRLVDNPFFTKTVGVLDTLTRGWKQLQLIRPAYTIRVIGEEQLRMAASGYDSLFAHPLSYVAALVGNDKSAARFIGAAARRNIDVQDEAFLDGATAAAKEMRATLNAASSDRSGTDDVLASFHRLFRQEDGEQFTKAWHQSLQEIHDDPVMSKIAEGRDNLIGVKRWFYENQQLRMELHGGNPKLRLDTPEGADRYIDNLWENVQGRTGGDATVLDAVATGRFNDKPIGGFNNSGKWEINPEFEAALQHVSPPEEVKGAITLGARGQTAHWDKAMGHLFDYLMTKPTNYLSRSPVYRQAYWRRVEEMLPFMDEESRAAVLANAALEGAADPKQLARMRHVNEQVKRLPMVQGETVLEFPPSLLDEVVEGEVALKAREPVVVPSMKQRGVAMPLADVDLLAKKHALNETQDLLYDASQKSQFFDVMRMVMPFGEAWKEVITRWTKIVAENPKTLRKTQQIITGGRGADPDGDGQGFFHTDANGNEVFSYPGSKWLSKMAIGVPIDLTGQVAGLSMMTDVMPGAGPLVQISAAALLPDTPDFDFVREWISPFGPEDYSNGVLESALPGFSKRLLQVFGKGDPRAFASTVMDVSTYLVSTGEYDPNNAVDLQRLMDDSKDMAKGVYMLRGLAQAFSPTAPSPQFFTKVKGEAGEKLLLTKEVSEKFREMLDTAKEEGRGWEGATQDFIDQFGKDALLATQGKSISITPRIPLSSAVSDWERKHGSVVKDYKLTWGLYAPAGDTEEVEDFSQLDRQIARGDRMHLTPQQRIAIVQKRLGQHVYEVAESKVSEDPTKAEKEWLQYIKQRIRDEYPVWGEDIPGLPARYPTEQVVDELWRSANDKRLANTPQGKAAREYLAAREQAIQAARERGATSTDGQALSIAAAADVRAWLASRGRAILAKYPEFSDFYDAVFSREVDI